MEVLKGNLGQSIITDNQKLNLKHCTDIILENLGGNKVTIGIYPLLPGKRVVFKSSTIILDKYQQDLDIKFAGEDKTSNKLYIQTVVATEYCNCLDTNS